LTKSLKQETAKGFFWSAIERFSVQGLQFLMGLVLARLLLPSDYGLVGMLTIFLAISQPFIDSGFSSALIQKKNRNEMFKPAFVFDGRNILDKEFLIKIGWKFRAIGKL